MTRRYNSDKAVNTEADRPCFCGGRNDAAEIAENYATWLAYRTHHCGT